jgi:hypothetical protein
MAGTRPLAPRRMLSAILLSSAFQPVLSPSPGMARLDRPIGWWLLLLPCWWSERAGQCLHRRCTGRASWRICCCSLVGAVAMRGAGSTWNDIVDRDLDGQGRPHAFPADCRQAQITHEAGFRSLHGRCSGSHRAGSAADNSIPSPSLIGLLSHSLPVLVYPVHEALHQSPADRARPCLCLGWR